MRTQPVAGQARRHRRSPRPRARDERRRRHDLRGAVGKSTTKQATSRSSAPRSATAPAKDRQELIDRLNKKRAFAYVRRQVSPEEAQKVAGAQSRRHRLPQGEPSLLSEHGARGAPARLRRHRQQGPERHRVGLRRADSRQGRPDPRPDRRARPRVQPVRASADLRVDDRADDRRVPAAHRRARAARRRPRQPRRRRQRRSS